MVDNQPIPSDIQQALFKVASQDNGMAILQQFVAQNSPMDPKEQQQTLIEKQTRRVCDTLATRYEFVRILGIEETGVIYYRPTNPTPSPLFRPLTPVDSMHMVTNTFNSLYHHKPVSNKIKTMTESLSMWVDNDREGLDNSLMDIAPGLYWDTLSQDLTATPDRPCFRRLFDSRPTDIIKVPYEDVSADTIKLYYEETLSLLDICDGYIDPPALQEAYPMFSPEALPLSPFWTWANEDTDTFNDLLKAVASCFMRHKPKGAFILIGRTRNGKSSFVKMLHTLFGTNNTSDLRLTELDAPRRNMAMLRTMMNAPDEEDEGKSKEVLENQANFKSMSAHEPITLGVFFSQKAQPVSTDFMSFFPMNDIPNWQGNGAEACMRRSLILMFRNDLSKFDNNGHNFEEETYTADFYSRLLGVVLAIAHYYNGRKLEFSDTMAEDQKSVTNEVASAVTYLNSFFKYFDAYSDAHLVYEDYAIWCKEKALNISNHKVFSSTLKMREARITTYTTESGERIRAYKVSKDRPKKVFYADYVPTELGNRPVRWYLTRAEGQFEQNPHDERSVVSMLEVLDGEV